MKSNWAGTSQLLSLLSEEPSEPPPTPLSTIGSDGTDELPPPPHAAKSTNNAAQKTRLNVCIVLPRDPCCSFRRDSRRSSNPSLRRQAHALARVVLIACPKLATNCHTLQVLPWRPPDQLTPIGLSPSSPLNPSLERENVAASVDPRGPDGLQCSKACCKQVNSARCAK